ncbi:MAG: carboxypeptidase-like regulatory domain-containing protein, partial [Prolixibacteraceae bacterium]|nr:carboxypeptidase-like regulatory domain-containing protein [Prolixibacteraceae bacterium]
MEKNRIRGFLTFLLLAVFMAFSPGLYAQQKTLQGKVTDVQNVPLPGVSVVVKGTTVGTVTNMDGDYTLEVPADA